MKRNSDIPGKNKSDGDSKKNSHKQKQINDQCKGDKSGHCEKNRDFNKIIISGKIDDFTVEGKGVFRHEGIVYFTEGGVIGDTVVAEVQRLKKNFGEARVTEILKPSAHRIPSDCSAFSGDFPDAMPSEAMQSDCANQKCGGCDFRNFSYDAQLEWKKKVVLNAITKIGGIHDPEIDLLVGAETDEEKIGYRNNIQLPVRRMDGRVRIGFFSKRSNFVVPFDECRLMPPRISNLIHILETLAEEYGIPVRNIKDDWNHQKKSRKRPFHSSNAGSNSDLGSNSDSNPGSDLDLNSGSESAGIYSGVLKHLGIRISPAGELVLIFVTDRSMTEELVKIIDSNPFEEIIRKYHMISVYENVNPENSQTFGSQWNLICGRADWEECILGRRFKLVPASFFQVNRKQTEKLYRIAISYAQGEEFAPDLGSDVQIPNRRSSQNFTFQKIKTLLDLYCGVGSIGICASDFAEEIVGIEIVEEAVQNAQKNAELNGVGNVHYYAGACEDLLSGVLKHLSPEVVILDPPRAGVEAAVLHALTGKGPERMVYVSCNPTTLARDIKIIAANGYTLKKISVVDMFPFTTSVECIALLQRGKS